MDLSDDQRLGFGVALNEATLLGAELGSERRVGITFSVLALPEDDGPPEGDRRRLIGLRPVGRIAASLRNGRWDDRTATVEPFRVDELLQTIQGFQGLPVYGWEFLDRLDDHFLTWSDRLSLDWRSGPGGQSHTLDLFQEGPSRHLDLRLWFDDLLIFTPDGQRISLDDFNAAGKRWWDGLHAGDPRTKGYGIFPGAPRTEVQCTPSPNFFIVTKRT